MDWWTEDGYAASLAMLLEIEEQCEDWFESKQDRDSDIATIGAMLGFAVMMTLDVALG